MFFKRSSLVLLTLASLAIIVLAFTGSTKTVLAKIPFISGGPSNSLTGLSGSNGPVLVAKIDDTTFAHPQVGLKDADIVYIEQVEGGLTRLAAVFSSKVPQLIGPVRSARISDIDLLSQYGKVGFAYSGAQKLMQPVIASANLFDLGATHYGSQFYDNDPARVTPYAMMLQGQKLLVAAESKGELPVSAKEMGWKFGAEPENLQSFSTVHISWPASSYDATWSQSEERWLLTHSGSPDVDETGYQLGPKTLVIQIVSITDSIYHDKVGGVTPFSATIGSGDCYLLRNGGYIPCKWSRTDAESGTTFTDRSGGRLTFDRGQIWFALTSKEPVFAGAAMQDATKSASK